MRGGRSNGTYLDGRDAHALLLGLLFQHGRVVDTLGTGADLLGADEQIVRVGVVLHNKGQG